jgi:hypothetical protein
MQLYQKTEKVTPEQLKGGNRSYRGGRPSGYRVGQQIEN